MLKKTIVIEFKPEGGEKITRYFRSALFPVLEEFRREAQKIFSSTQKSFGLYSGVQPQARASSSDREYSKAQAEIKRFQQSSIRMERELTAQVEREAKLQNQIKTREMKRAADDMIAQIKRVQREETQSKHSVKSDSAFQSGFLGGVVGGLIPSAAQIVGSIPQQVSEAFNKGLQFQQSEIALANITGSMDKAKAKIIELVGAARDTAGLSFRSAIEGQTRLESVSIEAKQATELLKGLSNIRVLSSASKQDFDAVIYNLTQIRAQGKLTGDELRETIGRMPYMARVIKDAFGTLDTKAIAALGLTSDQFFDKLLTGLRSVPKASNDAGLAIENLQDSMERWQANVGTVISQNPELIALVKTLTYEVDRQADSYNMAGVNVANFADRMDGSTESVDTAGASLNKTTTSLSKLILEVEIFGLKFDAAMKTAMIRADELGNSTRNIGRMVASFIDNLVNLAIIKPVNQGIDGINYLIERAKGLNLGVINPALGSISNLSPIAKLPEATPPTFSDILRDDIYSSKKAMLDVDSVWKSANEQITRYRTNYDKYLKETIEGQKNLRNLRESGGNSKSLVAPPPTSISGNKGNQRINELLPDSGEGFRTYRGRGANFGTQQTIANLQTFAQNWAEISKTPLQIGDIAKAGGGKLAGHKAHTDGNQADFRAVRKDGKLLPVNINDPQYDREMTRRQIQVLKQTIPGAKVLFNDPTLIREGLTQYAKGHDDHYHANRLGGSVYGGDNFRKRFEDDAVEADNKLFLKERMERMQKFYSIAASVSVPDEVVRQYTDFLNKDVKRDRDKKAVSDVREEFFARKDLPISTESGNIGRSLILRQTPDEQYISNLRQNLGLEEGANGEKSRYTQLVERERNLEAEIKAILEDQAQSRRESVVQAKVDYETGLKRNVAEEAASRFTTSRSVQINQIRDVEAEIALIKLQNADVDFVSARRYLSAKEEERSLLEEITDLQDRLSNNGINDSLRIQAALLSDILEIRERETEAVIRTNRAQLELSQSMVISNNQIRAGIYEHLAGANNINDAYIRGFAKTFDALDAKINSSLDALDQKTKGYLSFIIEPLKAYQTNALSNVTAKLVDAIFPPDIAAVFKSTGNPMLDENKKQSDYLKRIADAVAPTNALLGTPSAGGLISNFVQPQGGQSGGLSGILGTLLGGIFGGRGTGNLPVNYAGGDIGRSIILPGGEIFKAPKTGGGILGGIFGKGGIFGDKGFGNNVGTYQMLGMGANLLGGVIGGNFGGFLGGAGSGAAMGASIGSIVPGIGTAIGAGIGAVAGGILGLFGANSARRKEEQIRDAAMRQALDGLNQIKSALDARPPTLAPDAGVNQAREIENAYFQAMNQLQDKKTRGIAIKDGNERVRPLVAQVISAADGAKAFNINRQSISGKLVGQFASGVYMDAAFREQYDGFKRYNGMMPGTWTGRDYIKALIADEELVLNRNQRLKVIQNAGFDVFAGAGIPNYPETPQATVPKFNTGASFATPVTVSNKQSAVSLEDAFKNVTVEINLKATGNITEADIESITLKTMASPQGQQVTNASANIFKKSGGRIV